MINLFQIIFIIFVSYTNLKSAYDFKKNKIPVTTFALWVLISTVGLIFVLEPDSSTSIARFLGIARGVDLIVYSTITILLFICYTLHLRIKVLEKKLKDLNTNLAIKDFQLANREKLN